MKNKQTNHFWPRCLMMAAFAALLIAGAQARTWTSADGTRTFEGELVSYDTQSGLVTVIHANGTRMSFTRDKLSEADIAFLKQHDATAPAGPAPAGKGLPGFDDALAGFAGEVGSTRGEPKLVHRWTPPTNGSVRIVGSLQKQTPDADAELHVLAGSDRIWSASLEKADGIRHAFDIPALDLTAKTPLSFMLSTDSDRVDLKIDFEFIPEPFASRWRVDLPDGYPISVSMHPVGGGTPGRRLDAKPVTNLTITGNYFTRTKEPAVSIHNVDGLHIHDNRVDSSDWISLQDCENTVIEENQTRK